MSAVTDRPAPAVPAAAPICGEKHPHTKGIVCTRKPHNGGHLDKRVNVYWPAEETP